MTEERTHEGALLENLQREMRGLAETMIHRLDRIDGRLERLEPTVERIDIRVGVLENKVDKLENKVDKLENKVDKLENKVDKLKNKVDKLGVFAGDAQQRLGRIEAHLQLNGSNPHKPTRAAPAKRSKKR